MLEFCVAVMGVGKLWCTVLPSGLNSKVSKDDDDGQVEMFAGNKIFETVNLKSQVIKFFGPGTKSG